MTDAIDAVCFDLDATLCTYTQRAEDVLEAACEAAGVPRLFPVEAYYDRFESYLAECEDTHELRTRCFGDLAVEAGHDREHGEALARAYAEERDPSAVALLPGARETIDAISEEYRVGLVTNGGAEVQRPKLEATGLGDAFETVVYAGYDAPPKPSPEPFELALSDLGTTADRAVYVGNSLTSDVAGARAAGLRSVWVPAEGDLEDAAVEEHPPDHTLDSLEEVLELPWV